MRSLSGPAPRVTSPLSYRRCFLIIQVLSLCWFPFRSGNPRPVAAARSFLSVTQRPSWRGGADTTASPDPRPPQPSSTIPTTTNEDASVNRTLVRSAPHTSHSVSSSPSGLPHIPDSLRRRHNTLRRLRLGHVDIYLMGTAHVSNDSSAHVDLLLRAVRPHAIAVELCDARTALLEPSNETNQPSSGNATSHEADKTGSDRTPSFLQQLRMTRQQQGGSPLQALSTVLLTSVQQDYADTLGVQLGGEFQCAAEYWRTCAPLHRPYLLLADRPLQLTLVRAWESLNLWAKCKVLVGLVWSSLFPPSKEEIRQWLASIMEEDSDLLTKSFKELQKHFPTLYSTIIDERDTWLAAKLTQICRSLSMRPQDETYRLVAIVGAGHVPGICTKLTSPSNQTAEQLLWELCQTRKWASDPVMQQQVIPQWVRDITQLQDQESQSH